MNKTAIKNFSIWARKKLIADAAYRAGLMGITKDGIAKALPQSTGTTEFYDIGTREPYALTGDAVMQRRRLVDTIRRKERETNYATAYKYVLEEVAYCRRASEEVCPRMSQIMEAGTLASSSRRPMPLRKPCGPFIFRSGPRAIFAYLETMGHMLCSLVYGRCNRRKIKSDWTSGRAFKM